MTTGLQVDKFGRDFLDEIVDWIANNLEPAEVFSADSLRDWADSHDFIHANDVEPANCKERDLEAWARDEGYEKP